MSLLTKDELLTAAASLSGLDLQHTCVEPVPGGKSGCQVYRIAALGQEPLILKILDPRELPEHLLLGYPRIAETEWRFYTELAPKLDLPGPRIYAAGPLPGGGSFILMEDLTLRHHIPEENHCWSDAELRSILVTYARLHGRSRQVFARNGISDWLNPDPRSEYSPDLVMESLEAFAANDWTRTLVDPIVRSEQIESLVSSVGRSLDPQPTGLLFNDFYPCNVAIPKTPGPAVIFDWQLAGSGPLAIDMVNIGLLGRTDTFGLVNTDALLEFYLDELGQVTGERPPTESWREQFRWAALLAWGVFMPRMVTAMERANQQGGRFSSWMANLYQACMAEWADALQEN